MTASASQTAFTPIGAAIDRVIDRTQAAINNGHRLTRAADTLRQGAQGLPVKLANMLHLCADGLAVHPYPARLCRNNADRLDQEILNIDRGMSLPVGMSAIHLRLASDTFEAAANVLREPRVSMARAS